MKKPLTAILIAGIGALTACHAGTTKQAQPTQVVYRFDDHRYLELVGFQCQGALWYTDTQRNIHTEVTSQFYRIFTKKYVHPSEKYIAITYYDASGVMVSKDYGETWHDARFTPGGGAKQYGNRRPSSDDILSFTVVNDQGFIQTKSGDLYISSKPFDDPRMMPGGTGIDYIYDGEKHHLRPRNNGTTDNSYWGKNYTSWASVQMPKPWSTSAYETNWQNIPNKVPAVKNYTGWDRMRCDPDLGLPAAEQGK